MPRPRPLSAIAACALGIAVLGLTACGPRGELGDEARKRLERGESAFGGLREGLVFPLDGVDYSVNISRELNPRDPEDRQYYQGPDPPTGYTLFGVFIRACNSRENREPRPTAREFAVVDTQDHRFLPLPLPEENPFAYQPERLPPGECIPRLSSAANFGPTGGVLLLYRLPSAALENRPLELEIQGVFNAFKGERQTAVVELDV